MGNFSDQNGKRSMSVQTEAQALLRELAAPAVPGERVAAAINRAARRGGLSAARVTKLWYGNARSILAEEMDQLRARAGRIIGGNDVGLRGQFADTMQRLDRLAVELDALRSELARSAFDVAGESRVALGRNLEGRGSPVRRDVLQIAGMGAVEDGEGR